ncbi:MAG: UvrD-helicase domain-containing protein [Desulfobacterales bacterium]|nr:UvrD-helicase domain-containing protein [Desulfobacterales bacterium]
MNFRIADTFTDNLAKLSNDEQKAVKTTAFDLQLNPANPGIQLHKIERAKDPNFCSVRVNRDIRLIVHKTRNNLILCYVGHHEDAYRWAERRKLEIHPKTGAAQLIEIRETVKEITIPRYVDEKYPTEPKPLLFENISDDDLLTYGVPGEWLNDVHGVNEDTVLDLAEHLPDEAAEALLNLAIGVKPQAAHPPFEDTNPFDHPDAQRRFRVMNNIDELERALDYPWEKWSIFLHPEQRQLVEKDYNGPARVSGSAGTGKTVVALHRAVFLARTKPDTRILLTTFSDTLANALRTKLRRLISNEPRIAERLEVHSLDYIGSRLYQSNFGNPQIARREVIQQILKESAGQVDGNRFSLHFLITEWEEVVDAWQLKTWEAYRGIKRLGRKTRLPEKQREMLWSIFDRALSNLKKQDMVTNSEIFTDLASKISNSSHPPFDFIVVDESQDLSVPQLMFFAAFDTGRPNSLFFAGDLGQRIFQQPFSWKSLGVDIRGRSRTLRINYRTTHQIRIQADRLLAPELSDVDGNKEERRGTISIFNGPKPTIIILDTPEDEIQNIAKWISGQIKEGLMPHEVGVFVRSESELSRGIAAVEKTGIPFKVLDDNIETTSNHISISTMHLAKGLEFRSVVVMACDDEIIPSQKRIETVSDDTDLEEVYNTERHLLYVACTRARDNLLISGVDPASEFIDDISRIGVEPR